MTHQPSSLNIAEKKSEARLQKRAFAVWFTGLPCSGKTTLANALHEKLKEQKVASCVLDGDELRKGLNNDLGFTQHDRKENIRRAAEASKLLVNAGIITLNCFITPTEELRTLAQRIIGEDDFIEVYLKCPVDVCELRDVKGMYRKARLGELKDFTGVSAPFEEPLSADLVLDTSVLRVDECVDELLKLINHRFSC